MIKYVLLLSPLCRRASSFCRLYPLLLLKHIAFLKFAFSSTHLFVYNTTTVLESGQIKDSFDLLRLLWPKRLFV